MNESEINKSLMKLGKYKLIGYSIILLLIISSCNSGTKSDTSQQAIATGTAFSIESFDALTNYNGDSLSTAQSKHLQLDYTYAIDSGFIIPSSIQTSNGLFEFKFRIKNTGKQQQACFYKIYFQNESYKFEEADSASGKFNPLAIENFYGSYNDSSILFRQTKPLQPGEETEVTDYLRIEGNPRCEPQFYRNGKNMHWMRNPRVGLYSFMLIATDSKTIEEKKIPLEVQNICLKQNNQYINPYYYFLNGDGKNIGTVSVMKSAIELKVTSRIDFSKGIYADASRFPELDKSQLTDCDCGVNDTMFHRAQIAQFMHSVSKQNVYENIPLISDVINDNYTKRQYNWNAAFIKRDETIKTITTIARQPCKTVSIDKVQNKAIIKNPAATWGNWKKESVGIVTRSGLTYGKWRVKAKLTQLLNKYNVWNGLTNAIWLIVQPDSGDWNRRRICNGEGYMRDYGSGRGDPRANIISYSEIDFEILKTASYCPDMVFPPAYKNPVPNKFDIKSWNVELPDDMKKTEIGKNTRLNSSHRT